MTPRIPGKMSPLGERGAGDNAGDCDGRQDEWWRKATGAKQRRCFSLLTRHEVEVLLSGDTPWTVMADRNQLCPENDCAPLAGGTPRYFAARC